MYFYRLVSVLSAPAPAMIRNDSITVWRISAEINCYFVKRSRLDPIRNFPTKSVKPKAVNSNPRHEHKFSQCLHSCLGDVMSPSLSVRSSSPLPASRSNWQDESLSSTPNARTHDNCICFVYSWTLFVFDVGGEPNPVPTLRLGGGLWNVFFEAIWGNRFLMILWRFWYTFLLIFSAMCIVGLTDKNWFC